MVKYHSTAHVLFSVKVAWSRRLDKIHTISKWNLHVSGGAFWSRRGIHGHKHPPYSDWPSHSHVSYDLFQYELVLSGSETRKMFLCNEMQGLFWRATNWGVKLCQCSFSVGAPHHVFATLLHSMQGHEQIKCMISQSFLILLTFQKSKVIFALKHLYVDECQPMLYIKESRHCQYNSRLRIKCSFPF